MKLIAASVLFGMVTASTLASADVSIRKEEVLFKQGETGATIKGKISGDQTVDYRVRAGAGQSLMVAFTPDNSSAYFNVIAPGADSALFIGSTSGNRFESTLPASGTYTIRVYLMRNAARRGESHPAACSARDRARSRAAMVAERSALSSFCQACTV